MLNKVATYHKDWLRIAYSFLNNKQDAEDCVQDMYIRIHTQKIKLANIKYKDEVNKYFIYIVIKNLALATLKNKARLKVYPVLDNGIAEYSKTIIEENYTDDYGSLLKKIDKEVKGWDTYERDLFELYMYSGLSLRDISYGTKHRKKNPKKKARKIAPDKELSESMVEMGCNISVRSMHTTINKCKDKLRNKFG